MKLKEKAIEISEFLMGFKEIKSCEIYGSIAAKTEDEYSDIDIKIDVSGIDNSVFITKIPDFFSQKYNVIFVDYAPSLVPEKYIVSIAISAENPFLVIDIDCRANPHFETMKKRDIAALNNQYEHILKLFIANLKHYIRGMDCFEDIQRMHKRMFSDTDYICNENEMIDAVFMWLRENADLKYVKYLDSVEEYI